MILSEKLAAAINQQVGNEFGASLEYVNIASYFSSEDMLHFEQIFFDQSDEERVHAMKLVRYLLDAGGTVAIPAIPAAKSDFTSAADAVETALNWEKTVTEQINNLMDIAVADRDYISQEFLMWFVNEQLEEISKMSTMFNIISRAGDNLLMAETYIRDAMAQISSVEGGSPPAA